LDGTPKQVFSQFGKLKEAGLDVPQVTELMRVLNEDPRYNFPADVLDEKEAADIIEAYI
jgi:hypothetical protein